MRTREQDEKRHEITVGLMILIGIALIIFVIFAVSRQQGLLEERYELNVHMSRVNGLQIGAPVRLSGVRVGSVTGLEFGEESGNTKIQVTLQIQKSVQGKIRENSKAYIGTLGLLGDKFVSITMGTKKYRVLENGDELQGSDPVDIEKLIDKSVGALDVLQQTGVQLKEISEKINSGQGTIGLLVNDDKLYENLNSSMTALSQLQTDLTEGQGTLAKILRDTTMYDELYTFLKNANILADSLVNGDGSAAKFVNDKAMYNELVADLQSMKKILAKIDSGHGSAGKLLNDENLYEDIVRATAHLDSLLIDIKKNPKRYLTVEVF